MTAWLTRNWGSKLIALLLAIGLWYYAVGEENVEVKRVIPLEIKVENEQMSVLKCSVRNLWVTLVAPRALLSDLTSKDIRAVHVIGSDVKSSGEYSFRLESREIKLPNAQIRVSRIMPEIVLVTLDELIVQKLKIEPNLVGDPAFGYEVNKDQIEVDPNAIMVEGPKGQLESINLVKTQEVNLVGRVHSFRRTVELNLPSNLKAMGQTVVEVYVPISEQFGEKPFENIPVKILQTTEKNVSAAVEPKAVVLVLKGARVQLEKLLPTSILAYIDVSGLPPGKHQMPLQVVLPQDVSLKESVTVSVNIT